MSWRLTNILLSPNPFGEGTAQSQQQQAEQARFGQKQQAEKEINELKEKIRLDDEAKRELAKFRVNGARFYREPRQFGEGKPIIELSVKNDTTVPVSRAYFVGTLASPGRSIPWLKDDFNYAIEGGLEPNESREFRLAPNMFGKWGTVNAPAEAVLTGSSSHRRTKWEGCIRCTAFYRAGRGAS